MVNIVKFAQFYCIYLPSSAQMSAEEKQIRCFYKKNNLFYGGSAQWNWNFVYSTHFRQFAGRRYVPYNFMFF